MSKIRNLHIVIGILSILGCSSSLTKQEYLEWVKDPDNGMRQERMLEGFKYAVQYKPIDYMIAKKNTDSLKAEDYEDLHYIDLELSHEDFPELMKYDLPQKEDYYLRLKYYSFDIQKDLKLVDGTDTMDCVFSHLERTYGVLPYIKIVTAFEKSKKAGGDKIFSYNDKIFNQGVVNIMIRNKSIENRPEIKI